MNHFQKQNPFFIECYHEWRNIINEENYTNEEINERFTLINKPYNSYCPFDYVDFNCIVDSIITLSQPYGEISDSIKEDKIVDLVKKTSLNPVVELAKMKYNIGTNLNSTTAPTDNINRFNNLDIQINNNNDISKETSNLIDALSSLQKSNDISNSFNNDVFNLIYPNFGRNNNIEQNNSNVQKGSPIVKEQNLSIFGFFPLSSQTQKGIGNSQEQNASLDFINTSKNY